LKSTFTAPSVSSLEQNGIKDLLSIDSVPEEIRIVQLEGTPVRIEVGSTGEGYAEMQAHQVVKITNYDFSRIAKFFYKIGYLYGFVKDGNIKVYDVFTNDNFLSVRDLNFLKENFGLPLAEPIKEGKFSAKEILDFINKLNIDLASVFVLPSVYINDQRNSIINTPLPTYQMLFGKRTYEYYGTSYYGSNYQNTKSYNSVQDDYTTVKPTLPAPKTKKAEVFELTAKDERHSIFKETWKNISTRLKTIKKFPKGFKEWFNLKGKTLCYLYAIHTLPASRKIIYDYVYSQSFDDPVYDFLQDTETFWTWIFLDFFYEEFSKVLEAKKFFLEEKDYTYFEFAFYEELSNFNTFFEKEEIISVDNVLDGSKKDKEAYNV